MCAVTVEALRYDDTATKDDDKDEDGEEMTITDVIAFHAFPEHAQEIPLHLQCPASDFAPPRDSARHTSS